MKIITTAVIKGGTGKTSTTAALAQLAAHNGKKVLAIDLDPQSNLSMFLDGEPNTTGSLEFLQGVVFADCMQETEQGIDLLSGHPDLAIEETKKDSTKRLYNAIKPIKKKYDYIFVDTPPTIGELTFNGLFACTDLLIPLETDSSSIQGLYNIIAIAHDVQKAQKEYKTSKTLNILGVVLTRYDGRPNINKQVKLAVETICNNANVPFLGCIRPGIAIREAQANRQSLYDYAPKSNPAIDYMELFNKIK